MRGLSIGLNQSQILSAARESEVCMQITKAVDVRVVIGVFFGCEYDEVLTGFEADAGGKPPWVRVGFVIGEAPVFEIKLRSGRIVNFNPVRGPAVPIDEFTGFVDGQLCSVVGHELTDDERAEFLLPVLGHF